MTKVSVIREVESFTHHVGNYYMDEDMNICLLSYMGKIDKVFMVRLATGMLQGCAISVSNLNSLTFAEFKELSDGSEFTYISEVAVKAVMQQ